MKTDTKPTENLAECGNKSKPLLADVVSLEESKRLSRFGWKKGQTKIKYEKEKNSSVYLKTDKSYVIFGFDAPSLNELKDMCYAVGLIGLPKEITASQIISELISYCKRQNLKLSDYYIC